MNNEKSLTLEEMAKLIETVPKWIHIYKGSYSGRVGHYGVSAYKSDKSFFDSILFWWLKEDLEVKVYYSEGDNYIKLESKQGKEVLPLYQRIQELYNVQYEKESKEELIMKNEKLRELREKLKK